MGFMPKERWFIRNYHGDFNQIAERFQISPITARLLVNRGLQTDEAIDAFLSAADVELQDPGNMKDLEKACRILLQKIREKKPIRIIGDYDVDGVMSTVILYRGLGALGAERSFAIPDRIQDGYGLNRYLIDMAIEDRVDTILTCDNGISAFAEVGYAKEKGLTVLITDHHEIPTYQPLPPADTITDPKQEDCAYSYKELCGAGIALQLIRELYRMAAEEGCLPGGVLPDDWKRYYQYAALATICDVCPLTGENRTIVTKGLRQMNVTDNPGFQALIEQTGLSDRTITVYHCGFVLGPCINASGRLATAEEAMRMFLAADAGTARTAADHLVQLNEERKLMTEQGVHMAEAIAGSESYAADRVLVLYLPDVHESIAGIIAGRIKEKFHKPTLLLVLAESGVKGSGRSIEAYSMYEELSACAELFQKFGGHPMAAGFTMAGKTTADQEAAVEALRKALNARTTLTEEDLSPRITFDMVLPFAYADERLIAEVDRMAPFGTGNEHPLFARKDVHIHEIRVLGVNRNALRLSLTDGSGGAGYTGMLFMPAEDFAAFLDEKYGAGTFRQMVAGNGDVVMDILYSPEVNEYRGNRSIQLMIRHFR